MEADENSSQSAELMKETQCEVDVQFLPRVIMENICDINGQVQSQWTNDVLELHNATLRTQISPSFILRPPADH